jgi:GNAT superfamily N-acetyltransferase
MVFFAWHGGGRLESSNVIRQSTTLDLPDIFSLYVKMEQEFPYRKPVWNVFRHTWTERFSSKSSTMFLSETSGVIDGFIGGFLFEHLGAGSLFAMELLWYVIPERRDTGIGSNLLCEFEHWAKRQGAEGVFIGKPFRGKKLSGQMLGYRSIETMFLKEL